MVDDADEGLRPLVHLDRTRRGPVREPEVAELRAFCAAATAGSIAAAARTLNVTQPALSKRLRTLEAVAGAKLLRRSPRGVTLTDAGLQLYGAARRVLASADAVLVLLSGAPATAIVRLASSIGAAEGRLPGVLAELAQVEPDLAVDVLTANSLLVRELVREGRSDLGIAALDPDHLPEDGLNETVIWRDEIVFAVPLAHPWARLEEVPPGHVAGMPVIWREPQSNSSRIVLSALERAGVRPAAPAAAVGSTAAMLVVARATAWPALISLTVARELPEDEFTIRRMAGLRFDREFAVVWGGALSELEPPVQAVAQHLLSEPFARSRRTTPQARAVGAGTERPVP